MALLLTFTWHRILTQLKNRKYWNKQNKKKLPYIQGPKLKKCKGNNQKANPGLYYQKIPQNRLKPALSLIYLITLTGQMCEPLQAMQGRFTNGKGQQYHALGIKNST